MNLDLEGKSVIVTGGGSNIGRAISLAFAREGVHLTVDEITRRRGGRWRRRHGRWAPPPRRWCRPT